MDIHLFCLIRAIFRVFVGHSTVLVELGPGDGIGTPGRGFFIGGDGGITPGCGILCQRTGTVAECRSARGRSAGIVAESDGIIVLGNRLLAKSQRTAAKRCVSSPKATDCWPLPSAPPAMVL